MTPMTIRIDHVAVPARDPERSARFLAEVLGVAITRDGPDDEFACVAQLMFSEARTFEPYHLAFRTDERAFLAIVERLRAQNIGFGNDPEDPRNMQTTDPLGGFGRVYFADPDRHLFEVCA